MRLVINIITLRLYRFFFVICFLCFTTYSSEEIVISGLGFARFGVTLVPEKSFSDHPDSRRWLRIIDHLDMKILLKLERRVSESGTLVSKHLMLTVADNDGVPLFPLDLLLRKNRFLEAELMDLINDMSAQPDLKECWEAPSPSHSNNRNDVKSLQE